MSAFYGTIDLLSSLPYTSGIVLSTRNREPFIESNPLMGAHTLSVILLHIPILRILRLLGISTIPLNRSILL